MSLSPQGKNNAGVKLNAPAAPPPGYLNPPQNSWNGMNFSTPAGVTQSSGILNNFPKLQAMFGGAQAGGGGQIPPPVPPTPPAGTPSPMGGGKGGIQGLLDMIQQLTQGGGQGLGGLSGLGGGILNLLKQRMGNGALGDGSTG